MSTGTAKGEGGSAALAPLREPTFRRIWFASLFSSFGQTILGVGAAWEMTRMTDSPSMIALVQTAMMLPLMLVALPAGAVADMFDRRKIALTGLGFSVLAAAVLTGVAYSGLMTPWVLLLFCMLIGGGVALYAPSWQASIGEQVNEEQLPAAIALGTISYNIARSIGPAIGAIIIATFGAMAAFAITSAFYIPLLMAFFAWQRQHIPLRLPPERIDRAIASGGRYARHSPAIRTVMTRALLFSMAGASTVALAPLVAKDLLGGDALVFGLLLSAQGIGAVIGAYFMHDLRARFSTETIVRICTLVTAVTLVITGLSPSVPLTCAAMLFFGACNIVSYAQLNVSVQLSAPRWVTARALSLYSASLTGGIAIGAWFWGKIASVSDVSTAIVASGLVVALTLVLGWLLPLPRTEDEDTSSVEIGADPEVALDLSMRSGPVAIEVEYDIDPDKARDFYGLMTQMERIRKSIGGFDWSISRDVANPAIWVERYSCPTWGDYLRMRDRYTQADLAIQEAADAFNRSGQGRRVRRLLERPYGSVRWKADSPDVYRGQVDFIGP